VNAPFFIWAEPLFVDQPALRDYYLAGQTPADAHFDFLLSLYWNLYELELEAGLLEGREMDYD
jgi:hypothetical protein